MAHYVPGVATAGTIPWEFAESGEQYIQYTWHSAPHVDPNGQFVATVIYDGTAWSWRVESLAPGHAATLGAGSGPSRDYCQELAVECVGKSFASTAPHGGLATAASHRYTLASGQRVDLSRLAGESVVLTLASGLQRAGKLHIGGHYLSLASPGRVTHVPSFEVLSVALDPAAHR